MKYQINFTQIVIFNLLLCFAFSLCNDANCDANYCSNPATCTKCRVDGLVNYGMYSGVCQACSAGYYSDALTPCSTNPCATNCQKCTSNTVCQKCLNNYQLSTVSVGTLYVSSCTACSAGQWSSGNTGSTCGKCTNNCMTCQSATQCSTCMSNYGLQPNKVCIACNAGQTSDGITCKAAQSATSAQNSNTQTIVLATVLPIGIILLIVVAICIYKKNQKDTAKDDPNIQNSAQNLGEDQKNVGQV